MPKNVGKTFKNEIYIFIVVAEWQPTSAHDFFDKSIDSYYFATKMSREIPTLSDLVIKVIARYPSKCMTEEACGELLDAITKGCFSGVDIIQLVVSNIIEAGRMTDEGVHPSIFLNRSVLSLANSKISGLFFQIARLIC